MKPFFKSPDRQAALWAQQQRWLNTPFFPHAESCGHGVDCVRLQHATFTAVGAFPALTLPAYSLDHAKHVTRSQLLHFLLTAPEIAGRFVLMPFEEPRLCGDLIGLNCGRADHHLACVNPYDEVVHAVEKRGVIRTKLNDKEIRQRTVYVLRLMEAGK